MLPTGRLTQRKLLFAMNLKATVSGLYRSVERVQAPYKRKYGDDGADDDGASIRLHSSLLSLQCAAIDNFMTFRDWQTHLLQQFKSSVQLFCLFWLCRAQ